MMACAAVSVPAEVDEVDLAMLSRLLSGSRTLPFAVIWKGKLALANPAFMELFRAHQRITGMTVTDLFAMQDQAALDKALSAPAERPVTFRGRGSRLDGSSFDVEMLLSHEALSDETMICVFAEDVTCRRFSESHLSDLAYTDMLTGLPNRALVLDRLRDVIVEARNTESGLAVFMADLDGLKRTNDTYGHQAGDRVLQVMAQRFQACVRDGDTLARLGGDEFCFLLPRVRDARAAEVIAARLVEAAREPISINANIVQVGTSVGIAIFPGHGATGDALIAAADAALYGAKKAGGNRFALASEATSQPIAMLPLVTWTTAHDVGIAMMDMQHRHLAEHLNELAASLGRGADPAVISDKLAATLAYTRYHFESEERLMDAHGFTDATAHRECHAHLLDDLRNFADGCDRRSLSLTTRFLQEWLLRHIDSADRELASALKARGVH